MNQSEKSIYEFGPFRLDTAARQLLRDSSPVVLTPKVYDLLLALVENSGRLIEKDELMQLVWPDTIVEENNLTVNMSTLRKALGAGEFIETLPRRGYRFIAQVRLIAAEPEPSELIVERRTATDITVTETIVTPPRRRRAVVLAALSLIVLTAAGYYIYSKQRAANEARANLPPAAAPRRAVAVLGFRNLTARADAAWLSTAFAEMLGTELAASGKLRMIPGENVARMKLELALPEAESFAPHTLTRIHANLGADLVILGSYAMLGPAGQSARVRAANGQVAEALRRLRALLNEVTQAGFVSYQFEARLALGELEIQAGQYAAGRARLTALAADARARGFELLARRAAVN